MSLTTKLKWKKFFLYIWKIIKPWAIKEINEEIESIKERLALLDPKRK